MVDTFVFSLDFSGSKPNLSNCEITGIGVLKGVQVEFCGRRCVDLTNDTLKILGTHFCYNEETDRGRKPLHHCSNYSNLTLEGKSINFKTLAMSKSFFSNFDNKYPKAYREWAWKHREDPFLEIFFS